MSEVVDSAQGIDEAKKYYGGTITVQGRNLITSLIAGETIEFTRIMVGTGEMPEGVEPIDMTDLVKPVALGTSTIPVVENGELFMTVEYRNDMNGGLKTGFWLREFGIYAKTEKSEEILLYYATLGDSPQPVSAYKDNRIDIRRYPVTIALELDADVQVSYNPGAFVTAKEIHQIVSIMFDAALENIRAMISVNIIIPQDGWGQLLEDESSETTNGYPFYIDVLCLEAKEEYSPNVVLSKGSIETASASGLCPTMESGDGFLRFWAKRVPAGNMYGTAELIYTMKNAGSNIAGILGSGGYTLLPASDSTLGGVKVKPDSGLTIGPDGSLALEIKMVGTITENDTREGGE